MIPKLKERRSYVRGDFSYSVKFRVLSPDECRLGKMVSNKKLFFEQKPLKIASILDDSTDSANPIPVGLIEFLIRMDGKLDQIVTLLTENEDHKKRFKQGLGVDISATGMGIIADLPVVPKQTIQANIILSRLPLISLELIGEVVQVVPAAKDDKRMYHIGIRFLDLDENDKEKIIKCVFQNERSAIRERKRQQKAEKKPDD